MWLVGVQIISIFATISNYIVMQEVFNGVPNTPNTLGLAIAYLECLQELLPSPLPRRQNQGRRPFLPPSSPLATHRQEQA